MSLIRDTLPNSYSSVVSPLIHCTSASHHALWLQSGRLNINDEPIEAEQGLNCRSSDLITNTDSEAAIVIRFVVSALPLETPSTNTSTAHTSKLISSQAFDVTDTTMLLRLDQVDFPPEAIAYKHTHPGPGIRYLVAGGLQVTGEHFDQLMSPGEAWFEDANSIVTARAIEFEPSRFIRTMLLPVTFEGRSTFTLQDQSDAEKLRLQTNIRHFETRITISGIH